jgi:hypothetical protein
MISGLGAKHRDLSPNTENLFGRKAAKQLRNEVEKDFSSFFRLRCFPALLLCDKKIFREHT